MMLGNIVEDFTLKDQYSNDFNLYKNLNQKVLLVFYPKDNSLVCSRQLADYNGNLEIFKNYGIKIVGVNIGEVLEHQSFCEQKGLKFPILSDIEKKVRRRFKALNLFGMNNRKIVLIDENKKVIFEKTMLSISYLDTDEIIRALKNDKII